MEDLDFYKEAYYHELDKIYKLNDSYNTPILLLTAVISIHSFAYIQGISAFFILLLLFLSFCTFCGIIYSITYIAISYANTGKAYKYEFISSMDEQKKYFDEELKEKEAEKREEVGENNFTVAHKKEIEAKVISTFNEHLKSQFAKTTAINFANNKKRAESLAKAKAGIVFSVSLTIVFSLVFTASLISKTNNFTNYGKEVYSTTRPEAQTNTNSQPNTPANAESQTWSQTNANTQTWPENTCCKTYIQICCQTCCQAHRRETSKCCSAKNDNGYTCKR
ncbi:MAG: hypothetical protein IBJ09_02395 [Bacteroidia bacterium]|nr:hypothetical protein [Bacteroidia bacterium]